MSDYVIRVEDIGKMYRIARKGRRRNRMLRDVIQGTTASILPGSRQESKRPKWHQRAEDFWALQDISFEVGEGTSLGIIGRNGAGKSTLLKIISRITWPTTGTVRIRGRVGSLLEVGTGFHQELTGRENVFLNGAILGMRRTEIQAKFDEIVAFSEVEEFIDTQVKFYSSGMKMRLAFSVAAHLDPEIMLVDEVLAVGDIAFQRKSLSKMSDVISDGRTVLFVSHNIAAVRALCQKAVLLEQGRIQAYGDVDLVAQQYLDSKALHVDEHRFTEIDPGKRIQILSAALQDHRGTSGNVFAHDEPFSVRLKLAIHGDINQTFLTMTIFNQELETVLTSHDFEQDVTRLEKRDGGYYEVIIPITAPLLPPGKYFLGFTITQQRARRKVILQKEEHAVAFDIYDNGSLMAVTNVPWKGSVHLPLAWQYTRISENGLTGEDAA
ncbi:MAG: ABC transporter ATP-binding protein [Anaerolineae bacterium]|nr:ABC transporter ATP-binding protein [Anaerolineae bacterium]